MHPPFAGEAADSRQRRLIAQPLKRWPPVLLVVALVAGAIAAEHRADDPATDAAGAAEPVAGAGMPVARPSSALQSTWYCPGGSADPAEITAHTVVITNPGPQPLDGTITVFPPASAADGDAVADESRDRAPVGQPISVGAHDRVAIASSDLFALPSAALLVEVEGGGVVVEHDLGGPLGFDAGPCASEPSGRWYFADGATSPGAAETLVLFNPFPQDAVVDVVFLAEDGRRAPRRFNPLIVPARSVEVVPVADAVAVRERVSAEITVRDGGRIVVERTQRFDGSGARRGGIVPEGLTVTLGVPRPEPLWYFPDGRRVEGFHSELVLYNPGDREADLDVTLQLDDPGRDGAIEPFEVTVAPQGTTVLDLDAEDRVPDGVAHSIVVRTVNDVPVVAERLVVGGRPYVGSGVALTPGATEAAGRWVFAAGRATDRVDQRMVVQNPGARPAEVRVAVLDGGSRPEPLGEAREPFVVPARGRLAIKVSKRITSDAFSLLVESNRPIVVERLLHRPAPRGTSHAMGVPLATG